MTAVASVRRTPFLVALTLLLIPSGLFAQETVPGLFVTVPNPIREDWVEQVRLKVDRARSQVKNLNLVVFDFNPQGKESATTNYGVCYNFAKYIRALNLNQGVRTVGFVQAKTTDHTVLPALACNELVMTADAYIGQISSTTIPEPERVFYAELAGKNRTVFVQKMFDPNVQITSGLLNGDTVYFDARQAKDGPFANAKNPQPVKDFAIGRVELYPAKTAQHYEIAKKVLEVPAGTDKREALRSELNLDKKALAEQVAGEKGCKITISGQINTAMRESVNRQVKEAISRKEDTFFFLLESSGGELEAASELAKDILNIKDNDDRPLTSIAWIPDRASDLAIFIAAACQDVVMYRGPDASSEAVLGDFENYLHETNQNPEVLKRVFREFLEARKQAGRPAFDPLLFDALVDKDAVIVRGQHQKTRETRLFREAELGADKDWQFAGLVKPRGKLLELRAGVAKENGLVRETLDKKDSKALYALYSIDAGSVRDAEPHWLDHFAKALQRKEITIILILIGIGGLILELKAPGLMVPGIVAAICFVLFFWSQSQLNQKTIYLAVLLFILGLVLIAIEIFILPGFGVTGLSGILLVIGGLGLATVDKIPSNSEEWTSLAIRVMQYGLTMVGSTVGAMIFARYLPKIPYANRLMLVPPVDGPGAEPVFLPGAEQAASLLGHTGVATSMLRPAGSARFDEVIVDVVTEGDFIELGTPIQVIEVEGTRIVVKRM